MPAPTGWGTLGPFRLPAKLKEKFKELHKGKVEEQMITMIRNDVKKHIPEWKEEDELR